MSFLDYIPHAPQIGLFVAPNIPEEKLSAALGDFAKTVDREDVVALYDATLMGSAKDGAVFTRDRVVFQNNDLQPIHDVRYEDIVQVDIRRKLLGGRRIVVSVNRGRATFDLEMDFSGKPDAAEYVLRFLREAMLRPDVAASAKEAGPKTTNDTDVQAVIAALDSLRENGLLSDAHYEAMLRVIGR